MASTFDLETEERSSSRQIRRSKYAYDYNVFARIDNELSAYWLGFLYADGSIRKRRNTPSTVALQLSYKDVAHITKYRNWIAPDKPIMKRPVKYSNVVNRTKVFGTSSACEVLVYSTKVARDLMFLGCIPNKTHKLKFPSSDQVPEKYISHFMRGYFDGDGTVFKNDKYTSAFSIASGTYQFIEGYIGHLYNVGVSPSKITRDRKSYKWTKYRRQDLATIYKFLYRNATVFLERKEDKFRKLLQLNGE